MAFCSEQACFFITYFPSLGREKGEQSKPTEWQLSTPGELQITARHHLFTGKAATKTCAGKINSSVIFPNLEGQVGVESNDSL